MVWWLTERRQRRERERQTVRLRELEQGFQDYKRMVNVLTGHPADVHKDDFRFLNDDGSLMFPDIN
jgi:hypothetical protein